REFETVRREFFENGRAEKEVLVGRVGVVDEPFFREFVASDRPADLVVAFEDEWVPPRAREIDRRDESVVPRTDDDRIVICRTHGSRGFERDGSVVLYDQRLEKGCVGTDGDRQWVRGSTIHRSVRSKTDESRHNRTI